LLLFGSLSGCTWFRSCVGKCPEKSHKLAEQARLSEEAGNLRQAAAFFERALEEAPHDPHLHRELARLLLNLNQPEKAQGHLEQAVFDNPDDVEANLELAQLYIDNHQAIPAAQRLDAALQNDPKHTMALVLRAKLAEILGDPQMALEIYHRVLGIDPNHVEARVRLAWLQLEKRQPHLSAPILRSVCQSSRAEPEEIAEARWALGIAYGQEHRWPDAVISLMSATEHRGELSADDRYRLAYAKTQLGDWDGAEEELDRALEIDPHHQNAQRMLAQLRQREQSAEATILQIGHSVKPLPRPALW
jgi:Tfp pilus assembly protein PilF